MSGGTGGGGGASRSHNLQSFLNNSLAIRQEIQRFESVHPSIYAIYDLIEMIPDQQVAQQIRDHVVCIEGELIIKSIHSPGAKKKLLTTSLTSLCV